MAEQLLNYPDDLLKGYIRMALASDISINNIIFNISVPLIDQISKLIYTTDSETDLHYITCDFPMAIILQVKTFLYSTESKQTI